jgi:hypothetical protein
MVLFRVQKLIAIFFRLKNYLFFLQNPAFKFNNTNKQHTIKFSVKGPGYQHTGGGFYSEFFDFITLTNWLFFRRRTRLWYVKICKLKNLPTCCTFLIQKLEYLLNFLASEISLFFTSFAIPKIQHFLHFFASPKIQHFLHFFPIQTKNFQATSLEAATITAIRHLAPVTMI